MDILFWITLFASGFLAATVGSLIGAGGGFILVPILLLKFPHESAGVITSMSQIVVLITSISACIIYARDKRISYQWSFSIAISGIIGMASGAYTVEQLSRTSFQLLFGTTCLVLTIYLFLKPLRKGAAISIEDARKLSIQLNIKKRIGLFILGLFTSFMGGILGIGGGILIVPSLVQIFSFPAHFATATSQMVILITSPAAVLVHMANTPINEKFITICLLGAGAIVGAQAGARISKYFSAPWLIRFLSLALGVVGIQLIRASLSV